MSDKNIEVGTFVKVINGDLSGGVYKVFDISTDGNFLSIGVRNATLAIPIENIIVVSEEQFIDTNYDELSQDVSFF